MMHVHKLTYNPFQENTYIVSDHTNECVIIDPGCYTREEQQHLKLYVAEQELKPVKLLNTHCHIDHVLGNYFVANEWGLDLEMHKEDLVTLNNIPNYAELYGFGGYQISPEPKVFLDEGDRVEFGESHLDVLFGPGHAPGHIAFYSIEEGFVINGDILFQGSFGRVDLPGGDFNTLKKTITEKMFALPDSMTVYTGHGPETKIGIEKQTNPIHHMQL